MRLLLTALVLFSIWGGWAYGDQPLIPRTMWLCHALLDDDTGLTMPLNDRQTAVVVAHAAQDLEQSLEFDSVAQKITDFAARALELLRWTPPRRLSVSDVQNPFAGLSPWGRLAQNRLIHRTIRGLKLLTVIAPIERGAYQPSGRIIHGDVLIQEYLKYRLGVARANDRLHTEVRAAEQSLRATEYTQRHQPQLRPFSRHQKLGVSLTVDALIIAGSYALGQVQPYWAAEVGVAGLLGWFGLQEPIFDRVARASLKVRTWVFERRRGNHLAQLDQAGLSRDELHVRNLEELIARAGDPTFSGVAYYAFDSELPLDQGSYDRKDLDAQSIFDGALYADPVPSGSSVWARVELILTRRNGRAELVWSVRRVMNPNRKLKNRDPSFPSEWLYE